MSPHASYDEPNQMSNIRNFADRVKASNESAFVQSNSDLRASESKLAMLENLGMPMV